MENNPFSQTPSTQDTLGPRRRSTRIDFVTTVLISGKDSSGVPFREFTQTTKVNLQGCKVRTSYRIMVGMLVTVECPKAGASGKGVCIKVWDPIPGVAGHEVAIQLIKPQNIWGVPNPPPDWETVVKTMVEGRVVQAGRTGHFPAPVLPSGPTPVMPITPLPVSPPPRPAPVASPTVEQRLAELERRSTQMMESVLDIMRGQAEELTRDCLEEFRQQVDALIADAEMRLRQGLTQTYEQSAASLIGLRTDLMDQMASRGAQMIRTTEDTLRTRLRNQLAVEDKTAHVMPPAPLTEKS